MGQVESQTWSLLVEVPAAWQGWLCVVGPIGKVTIVVARILAKGEEFEAENIVGEGIEVLVIDIGVSSRFCHIPTSLSGLSRPRMRLLEIASEK